MADYFPLISRAVAGLAKNTGENRRVLYDRARSALVAQLRGIEPGLNESDITRERLALEEAIRRVEADAAKRLRPDGSQAGEAPPSVADQGLRGFRDTMAEADGLGGAAAEARRSAREVYEAVPGEGEPRYGDAGPDTGAPYFDPRAAPPPPPPPQEIHDEHDEPELAQTPHRSRFGADADEGYKRPRRSYGGVIKFILLLLVWAVLPAAPIGSAIRSAR